MKKLIVIVGSTGTGKSHLAIELAKIFNAEIINADSFQVYKELNIGINKPSEQDLSCIKHHLINEYSIKEPFDIKIFQDRALSLIEDITKRNKNIIICGGSHLYIDALIKGYNLDKSSSREQITHFNNWDYKDIYDYVLKNDYDEAIKIGFNNQKRIIRAAQIIYTTNQKKSKLDTQGNDYVFDCFIIQTVLEKNELYSKINNRVDQMISNGLIEEVKDLINQDKNVINYQAFNAIGYKQISHSIINDKKIDIDEIKKVTRNLAKKQLTWCRNKYKDVTLFNISNDDINSLVKKIKKFLD